MHSWFSFRQVAGRGQLWGGLLDSDGKGEGDHHREGSPHDLHSEVVYFPTFVQAKQSNTKELAELAICSRAIVLLSSKVGGTTHSFWISSTLLPSLTCFTFSFSILSSKFSIFSWIQAGNSDWCSLSRVCQLTDALNYTNTWLPDFFYKYLYFCTMHRCISFLFVLYFYTALHTVSYCDSECSDSIRS